MTKDTPTHIAVVEDERDLRDALVDYLRLCNFSAQGFGSAEALYNAWADSSFSLVILDVGLPGDNGLQAAQWLRARNESIGIVMLTALGSSADQVAGLEMGADAYLVKDAALEVVEATCRSVLRRLLSPPSSAQSAAGAAWSLHPKSGQLAAPCGKHIQLSHSQVLFLQCLLRSAGSPVNRAELLSALGKKDTYANQRNLDSYASRLRQLTLKQCGTEIPIRPCYGTGYIFSGEGKIENA